MQTQLLLPRVGAAALLAGALVAGGMLFAGRAPSQAADQVAGAGGLVHDVYFSLKEPTTENCRELVAACHKYLSGEPGTVYFAVGRLATFGQPAAASQVVGIRLTDRDFDVGLHMVFKDHAAHDAYQTAPRHEEFRSKYKETWKQVRVFDSDVQ